MKYLIIDDNQFFAKTVSENLNGKNFDSKEYVISPTSEKLNILAETINKITKRTTDLVLCININLATAENTRQLQKGIELLIWLRIKDVINHCVLYSFETLHALLNREPKHLIATSNGTTFVQLPDYFSRFDFQKIKYGMTDEDNLKRTLKVAFDSNDNSDIIKFKHKGTNWWGLRALFEVHKVVGNNINIDYPAFVENELLELNNAVAKYIYEFKITKIEETIKKERESRENYINGIKPKIEELEKCIEENKEFVELEKADIEKFMSHIELIEKSLVKYYDEGLINERKILIEAKQKIEFETAEIQKSVELSEDDKKAKNELLNRLKTEIENILLIIKENLEQSSRYYDSSLISNIQERKPEILFIDDNAEKGWREMLSKILTGTVIQTIVPNEVYKNDIDKLYKEQVKVKITDEISLIMLDLRLFDEKSRSVDIENISGKKLLDIIRKEHKGIPIIITTASNKVWSYEELMKSGADAYWMKEGIDNNFDEKDSVNNYYRLLWLVDRFTGREYKFMRNITKRIEQLSLKQSHWFEDMNWFFEYRKNGTIIVPQKTITDKELIFKILWDGQSFLRSYLKTSILRIGYANYSNQEWFLASGIIRQLANIIEIIHDFETMRTNYHALPFYSRINYTPDGIIGIDGSHQQKFRGDTKGGELYKIRNKSSHYATAKEFTFKDLDNFIDELINYLDNTPANINSTLEILNETP